MCPDIRSAKETPVWFISRKRQLVLRILGGRLREVRLYTQNWTLCYNKIVTFSVSFLTPRFYFVPLPKVVLNPPSPLGFELSSSSCWTRGGAFLRFLRSHLSTAAKKQLNIVSTEAHKVLESLQIHVSTTLKGLLRHWYDLSMIFFVKTLLFSVI